MRYLFVFLSQRVIVEIVVDVVVLWTVDGIDVQAWTTTIISRVSARIRSIVLEG